MRSPKDKMRYAWPLLRVVGAATVVLIFFFGTLFILDYIGYKTDDSIRAEHAQLIKDALQRYRSANGNYPIFPDNAVDDLKKALVGGGFLRAIPRDPSQASLGWQYRYTSDGKVYGLLFKLEWVDGKFP